PLNLLPSAVPEPDEQPKLEPPQESFLRRALNRTREAFRSVDEALTNREALRRIEERHQDQAAFNDSLTERLESTLEQLGVLRTRMEGELAALKRAYEEQQAQFENKFIEITTTASELRQTADSAEQALAAATKQQLETQKQASEQLTRWNSDSESLK